MCHALSPRLFLLPVVALLTACATARPEPGAYGSPPSPASAMAQINRYVGTAWADRQPENLVFGSPQKAHHEQLSLSGGTLDWQGYAVPVTMDIDAHGGSRLLGRKYAALFSNGQLLRMVDYPGQANRQATMALYWDGAESVTDLKALPGVPSVAKAPPSPSPSPSPSSSRPGPVAVAGPVGGPVPAAKPVQPAAVPAAAPRPPVVEAVWMPVGDAPAIGTKVYLASNKAYAGVVMSYEKGHLYTNGLVVPAIQVRYLNGNTDWFPMKVAKQIYVVRGE